MFLDALHFPQMRMSEVQAAFEHPPREASTFFFVFLDSWIDCWSSRATAFGAIPIPGRVRRSSQSKDIRFSESPNIHSTCLVERSVGYTRTLALVGFNFFRRIHHRTRGTPVGVRGNCARGCMFFPRMRTIDHKNTKTIVTDTRYRHISRTRDFVVFLLLFSFERIVTNTTNSFLGVEVSINLSKIAIGSFFQIDVHSSVYKSKSGLIMVISRCIFAILNDV